MTADQTAIDKYKHWLEDPLVDETTKQELNQIAEDPKEIEDRFFRELEFGTGGLRGIIGAGTNRMNKYTIGKATQGLAQYILQTPGVGGHAAVIAYDSRHQSPEFALESALVLAGNGIKAYVFETLRPTPELSFAVRKLKAAAGIVITASHNPPEYNGYKAYGADGGQLNPDDAGKVIEQSRLVNSFAQVKKLERDQAEAQGLLEWVGEELDQAYIEEVAAVSLYEGSSPKSHIELTDINIVYTPLHGAGYRMVPRALKQIGCTQVHIVKEQEQPDANFSTVKSPNPEEAEAFTIALKLANQVDADIIIGTDPDVDRMGALVKDAAGQFTVLTGNQTGAILAYYLISRLKEQGKLPSNGVLIKTIVTSDLGAEIARNFGLTVMNTLTGFKYIGEKMTEFEQSDEYEYVFGYEESYGYLAGTYCRDKDAVVASMLICEAAAYYKAQGKSLYEVLQSIYETYGYYMEKLESRTLKGKAGLEKIQDIMQSFRTEPPTEVNGLHVQEMKDYAEGIEGLPKENVLKYSLQDGSWFCLRPSGTEPKIKVYFGVKGTSVEASQEQLKQMVEKVMGRLDQI